MTDFDAIAAAAYDHLSPSARKSGRRPEWPYVPIVVHERSDGRMTTTKQLRGLAYETRDEAVAAAAAHIEACRRTLARQLGERQYRALREQYGLPREIEDVR